MVEFELGPSESPRPAVNLACKGLEPSEAAAKRASKLDLLLCREAVEGFVGSFLEYGRMEVIQREERLERVW